jgi:hypothetical protein
VGIVGTGLGGAERESKQIERSEVAYLELTRLTEQLGDGRQGRGRSQSVVWIGGSGRAR